jgi:hypothetical protein
MADETKKDSRDRSKPDALQGAVPGTEQRRFRSRHQPAGDAQGDVAEGDTGGDAPMDPPDEAFIDDAK